MSRYQTNYGNEVAATVVSFVELTVLLLIGLVVVAIPLVFAAAVGVTKTLMGSGEAPAEPLDLDGLLGSSYSADQDFESLLAEGVILGEETVGAWLAD